MQRRVIAQHTTTQWDILSIATSKINVTYRISFMINLWAIVIRSIAIDMHQHIYLMIAHRRVGFKRDKVFIKFIITFII